MAADHYASPIAGRVVSIDALRGFDMFWIVGGKGPVLAFIALIVKPIPDGLTYHLQHPEWRGFSAWDMIMWLVLLYMYRKQTFLRI